MKKFSLQKGWNDIIVFIQRILKWQLLTISAINRFRKLRNRVFHNESICWNIKFVENIHNEILTALGWINVDLILWTMKLDSFTKTCNDIKNKLGWI